MQTLQISGVTCQACVKLISKRLMKLPEVMNVEGSTDGIFKLNVSSQLPQTIYYRVLAGTQYQLISLT